MILGLGTDLIDSNRIEALIGVHEKRFLDKYFTPLEQVEYEKRKSTETHILFLAKRFAAKEAFSKAIGTGYRDGLYMVDVEVRGDRKGKPYIQCHGAALEKLEEFAHGCKGCKLHLSLTDEPPYAQATVIIESL